MRTPCFAVSSVVTLVISTAPAQAGLTIQSGLANLSVFGPDFDAGLPTFLRSDFFNTSLGPIGPVTLTRPGVGVPYTQLSLTNFTESGFALAESGSANMKWSAWVAFAFTPTVDTYLQISGQLFGDPDQGLMMGVDVSQMDNLGPNTMFEATAPGLFASSRLTLSANVQYTISYQSNFGLGGGSGNGTLLDFSLAPVPAPGAMALLAAAGLTTTRRRRD